MTSINANVNIPKNEPYKSDLLQKYLRAQGVLAPNAGPIQHNAALNTAQSGMAQNGFPQTPAAQSQTGWPYNMPSYSMSYNQNMKLVGGFNTQNGAITNPLNVQSVLEQSPNADTFSNKGNSKKAKIAATSLGVALLASFIALLGATKSGRAAVGNLATGLSSAFKAGLEKFAQKHHSERLDKLMIKAYSFGNKAGSYTSSVENMTNGKDVLARGIENRLKDFTGRSWDTSKMGPVKKAGAVIYQNTIGRFLTLFDGLDKKSSKFYKDKLYASLDRVFKKAGSAFSNSDDEIQKVLNDLKKSPRANETIMYNGAQRKVSEVISEIETMLSERKTHLSNAFSQDAVKKRVQNIDEYMLKDENGLSLTQKTTQGFLDKLRKRNFKEIFQNPVAGGIIADKKGEHSAIVNGLRRSITNNLSTTLDQKHSIVSDLRNAVKPDDLAAYRKVDETVRMIDKYRKTVFDTQEAVTEAQSTLLKQLEELKELFKTNGAKNGVDVITPIDSLWHSVKHINPGDNEKIMSALKQVVEPETYTKVIKPAMRKSEVALNKACSMEIEAAVDKLRDINCGCAPTDMLTVIFASGGLGLYMLQADDADERVSVGLTTGLPILSTLGTCMLSAINMVSGLKCWALSGIAGLATTVVCNGLDKMYKKFRGIDENKQPSIVTIKDYVDPYKNKFENVFFETVPEQGTTAQ